jgi:hypothetical protein
MLRGRDITCGTFSHLESDQFCEREAAPQPRVDVDEAHATGRRRDKLGLQDALVASAVCRALKSGDAVRAQTCRRVELAERGLRGRAPLDERAQSARRDAGAADDGCLQLRPIDVLLNDRPQARGTTRLATSAG